MIALKDILFVLAVFFGALFANGSWTQQGSDIDGEDNSARFGNSVSLSTDGLTVAIGAPDNNAGKGTVEVYEYNVGTSSWSQVGSDVSGPTTSYALGSSVAMSSNGLLFAAGAPSYNSNEGMIKVYEYDGTAWSQPRSDIPGTSSSFYGIAVAVSSDGSVVAGGGYGHSSNKGVVTVYEESGTTSYTQLGSEIVGPNPDDYCGECVALSGDGTRLAFGCPEASSEKGRVLVYDYNSGTDEWVEVGNILGAANNRASGDDVSLSSDGTRLAIGIPGNTGTAYNQYQGGYEGNVEVYEYVTATTSWSLLGSAIVGEASGDHSGSSVSLSGDGTRVAIGSRFNAGNGVNAGHVRVYEYDGTTWNQLGSDVDGEAAADESGYSVSLDDTGANLAIGAPLNAGGGTDRGHTRVLEYSSAVPTSEPTTEPSGQPSSNPSQPSGEPSGQPSGAPSGDPTVEPSSAPTSEPSGLPSSHPSGEPTGAPSAQPSGEPTQPSGEPSAEPSGQPSSQPSQLSSEPSDQPSGEPTGDPTVQPSSVPSSEPSGQPSAEPSQPSGEPSTEPSGQPSSQPSQPSGEPSSQPSGEPSGQPSAQPSGAPSGHPPLSHHGNLLNSQVANPAVIPVEHLRVSRLHNLLVTPVQSQVDNLRSSRHINRQVSLLENQLVSPQDNPAVNRAENRLGSLQVSLQGLRQGSLLLSRHATF